MAGILQLGALGTGYPQSFRGVAAKGLALIAAGPVETRTATLFESDDVLPTGNRQRKDKVGTADIPFIINTFR